MEKKKTFECKRKWFYLVVVFGAFVFCSIGLPAYGQSSTSYDDLVKLHQDFLAQRRPAMVEGVPDYTPAAIEARKKALEDFRKRLAAIDASGWPVPQKVDYLLVKAELNSLDFDLRVIRSWERDPGLYTDSIRRIPYVDFPLKDEDLKNFAVRLKAVPKILEQGKNNLKNASGELARIAIFHLEHSDGVNQGEPIRPSVPEGALGWYQDLIQQLTKHHPKLVNDAKQALVAVRSFNDWLKQNESKMTEPAYLGMENYAWFVKNVRLMAFTIEEVKFVAEQEWNRTMTFLRIEEHKNRNLPKLEPAKTEAEHERRVREAETLIRTFVKEHKLLTMPDDIPPQFDTDARWFVRPSGKLHFWEELTYRDPLNNHIHASIPGHRYDSVMHRRDKRPIRGTYSDSGRAEGWAFYLEEMFLQAGLLDERPRTRELFYIAQLARALRIITELKMQSGEMTFDEAIKYMVKEVPLMEENLARYDLEGYMRRPASGMVYTIAKAQFEQVLADRARQLGDKFDLGKFHDEFFAVGTIPISLIRWELTGLDNEVKEFWKK